VAQLGRLAAAIQTFERNEEGLHGRNLPRTRKTAKTALEAATGSAPEVPKCLDMASQLQEDFRVRGRPIFHPGPTTG
jgi:hypothetical protein